MKNDEYYMKRAIKLAHKGRGRTSPNPMVGAVIVKNNKIIGEGFHAFCGGEHAEVAAIKNASESTEGSTIYVNLEPCNHYGKTPPCVDAILKAGIRKVFCAMIDPNEKVSGKGIDRLQKEGVAVDVGLLNRKALKLNEKYSKYIVTGEPFVLLKSAMSLDGKIAGSDRKPRQISSGDSIQYAHELRYDYDAIMVGIGTVLADNPALTVRVKGKNSNTILRVILDSRLRIPVDARLFDTINGGKIIIITTNQASPDKVNRIKSFGAEVIKVDSNYILLKETLKYLGSKGITSVLIEGGAEVAASALQEKVVDKIVAVIAPVIIGSNNAVTFVGGKGFTDLSSCPRLVDKKVFSLGEDTVIEGYVEYRH